VKKGRKPIRAARKRRNQSLHQDLFIIHSHFKNYRVDSRDLIVAAAEKPVVKRRGGNHGVYGRFGERDLRNFCGKPRILFVIKLVFNVNSLNFTKREGEVGQQVDPRRPGIRKLKQKGRTQFES